MSKINPNDFEKYSQAPNNSSEWLKLPNDKDVARVQFLYDSFEDLDIFCCHKVKVGEIDRYVDCKRHYDDPVDMCPFCSAQLNRKPVTVLSMYDHADRKIKIWERGPKFVKELQGLFSRYPNISDMVFEIERQGARGSKDTIYNIFPMPNEKPLDVSDIERPNLLGTFILDWTEEEMQAYLNSPNESTPIAPSRARYDEPRNETRRRGRY